jgi:hypothetical protein
MLVHVLRADPPELVEGVEPTVRWCFGCRKRLPHRLKVITGKYYDPEFFWYCDGCGESRTEFPI